MVAPAGRTSLPGLFADKQAMGRRAAGRGARRWRIGRAATFLTVGLMGPLLTCSGGGRSAWTTKSIGDSDPAVMVGSVSAEPQPARVVAIVEADGQWFRVFGGVAPNGDGWDRRAWAVAVKSD